MERKKAIIVGFVGVLTIFLFIWGMSFLKGKNIFKKGKNFYAVFEQVGGLDIGSPVTFKGYRVGQVKQVSFNDEIGTKLIITFSIDKDIKIPVGSIVEIYSSDLLGTKGLRVVPAVSDDFYTPGDTIVSKIQVSMLDELAMQIDPLKQKTEKLMVSLDSIIEVLNNILIDNENSITSSLTSISRIAKNFEMMSAALNKLVSDPEGKVQIIISDLQSITSMLKEKEPALNNAINNFSDISDSLAAANLVKTVAQTNYVLENLNSITTKINSGEGSLGQLLNNDTLYYNIEDLSKNLNLLIEDIQKNPNKYFKISVIDMSKTTNNQ